MAFDPITPEEKLLKIIETPRQDKEKPAPAGQVKQGASFKNTAVSFLSRLHIDKDLLKRFDLAMLNKALIVFCSVVTLVCILDFFNFGSGLKKRFERVNTGSALAGEDSARSLLASANLEAVLQDAGKRNMFSFVAPKPQVAAATPASEELSTYKLVGIIWSDNPQAMIENTKAQKTFLVNSGEQLGAFFVKKILKDRVMLGKGDQEWELR